MRDSMVNIHFLTILREDEFRELKKDFPHDNELLHSIRSIRYCKAEVFRDCILGTLRVPEKNEIRTPHVVCGFYMTDKELFLIEESGELKHWLEKKEEQFQELKSPDQFLLKMMELMIENDLLYLLHLEKEIEKMEDQLIKGVADNFFSVLTKYRQKLSELDAYYEQLAMIGDLLQSQDGLPIIRNTESWNRYALRTERLHNHVHLLRENILQLRELYQSQQDAQQKGSGRSVLPVEDAHQQRRQHEQPLNGQHLSHVAQYSTIVHSTKPPRSEKISVRLEMVR